MSDKLRVHTLSKELGVTSKAILDKCKREGIEGITNHMSTVSAGLAETLREWFSGEATHTTAVETAAPVDLEKVRTRRRAAPRRKKKEEETAVVEEQAAEQLEPTTEPETEPEEAPALAAAGVVAVGEPVTMDAAPVGEPSIAERDHAVAPAVVGPGVILEPAAEAPPSAVEGIPPAARAVAEAPASAVEPPKPPEPVAIRPAGPQNVPKPAQMKGPRVVGFARPDPVARPPSRSASPLAADAPDLPMTARRGRSRTTDREGEGAKSRARTNPRRSTGSLSEVGERLREWNERDLIERQERLQAASGRGIHRRAREQQIGVHVPTVAPRKTKAQVMDPIVMRELCAATGIGLARLFPKFKNDHNLMVSLNSIIPREIAEVVMAEFGVELEIVKPKTGLELVAEEFNSRERTSLQPRPPVVTMLGHVDHGKTSLLDAIRKTSVAEGEAGGITQHIGAYHVKRGDLAVTFLDTPGHEAFTAMRARGANMTDVVVLVVAADDGIMPQTIEAINHAKAAGVTIVVALNKIDLPGLDINKVYGQLSEHGLAPTEWGGETDVVHTSATTGQGVEELIAHLATLSDLLNLKADPTVAATGTVIEAEMRQGMGPLVRVLVREGTLKRGDILLCGPGAGRIRTMRDDRGRQVKGATPGMPVEVAGLDEVPNAGETCYCLPTLPRAKQIAEEVKQQRRQQSLAQTRKPQTLEELFRAREKGEVPELNLILRADVQGSVDALLKSLKDIPSDEVKLKLLHTGIGSITEGDVVLAEASKALVVGFNVTVEAGAQRLADSQGVDVRLYRIIYNIIDDIRKALEGLLPTQHREEDRGKAEVREIFHVSRVGIVAGCMVTDGVISRSNVIRVIRDGQIIVPTEDDVKRGRHRSIASLRRFKDDAKEVRAGMECGIRIEDFDDVKPGDVLQAYELIETARTL